VKNQESCEQEGTGTFKNSPSPILLYLEKIIVVEREGYWEYEKNRRGTREGGHHCVDPPRGSRVEKKTSGVCLIVHKCTKVVHCESEDSVFPAN
jgi:hypothetical protein